MLLACGYLNQGNYGDELLFEILEKHILEEKLKPSKIEKLYSKLPLSEQIKLITQSKKIIFIGGLFQDQTSLKNVFYYFGVVLLAVIFGKEIEFIANGLGPLRSAIAKVLARIAFSLADNISVRDRRSSKILSNWGIPHKLTEDLAWQLSYKEEKIDKSRRSELDSLFSEKTTFIALRDYPNLDRTEVLEQAIQLAFNNGELKKISICTINMDEKDSKIHDSLSKVFESQGLSPIKQIFAKDFPASELLYLLKTHSKQLISMRLHALILAKIAGIETQIIECDPKLLGV